MPVHIPSHRRWTQRSRMNMKEKNAKRRQNKTKMKKNLQQKMCGKQQQYIDKMKWTKKPLYVAATEEKCRAIKALEIFHLIDWNASCDFIPQP